VTGSGLPLLRVLALGLLFLFGQVYAADVSPPAAADAKSDRAEFLAAMQRVRQQVAAEPPDSPALIASPIYEYLVAARLRRDLQIKPSPEVDAAIDTFLQDHPREPVTHDLQHDWLVSLGGRGRWDWLLPRTIDASDPALICQRLAGRLAVGDTGSLADDALALWMKPVRQPHECDSVFNWLRQQNLITPGAAQTRIRAALAADSARLARDFSTETPAAQTPALQQWMRLLETPRPALNDLATHPDTPVEADALLGGYTRLSRSDSSAALSLLPLLLARADMTPELRTRLQRAAALGAAYDHNPAAVQAFRAVTPQSVDTDVFEWRIRSALWAHDFTLALTWINELPATLKTQPRWRYWSARATQAVSGATAAKPLYNAIAGMRDYYSYLAADHLSQPYDLNDHPTPDDSQAQATLASAPGLVRARELFDCDLLPEATLEWTTVLADAQPAARVQAAHLASHWGWYTQEIVTLVPANEWDDVTLRYPRPYGGEIERASTLTGLSGDWILAVMRQESLFRKDATSRADARGLMQLLPSTATAVAKRWQLPLPARDALFDPAVAIPIGAAYLKELNDRYHGQPALTFAAYNAGSVPLSRWMPTTVLDADIWIENIPYNETRNYVQRVLEHIVAYARVHAAPPPRLAAMLPPVEPYSPGGSVSQLERASDPPTLR
jgi:soluble lytic murein transglycosylase